MTIKRNTMANKAATPGEIILESMRVKTDSLTPIPEGVMKLKNPTVKATVVAPIIIIKLYGFLSIREKIMA